MKYSSFEDMPVWQKAMDLALSVSGNISEGFGREHTKYKVNFYYNSRGSLAETKNHLIYGKRVKYFPKADFIKNCNLINEIWKELNSLISSLKKNSTLTLTSTLTY